jgi:hypothetical protein
MADDLLSKSAKSASNGHTNGSSDKPVKKASRSAKGRTRVSAEAG